MSPTLKFSMTMSDSSANCLTIANPSELARSMQTDFFPRFADIKYAERASPSGTSNQGGPHARVSSPTPGLSILITSAPKSANVWLAQGPASTLLKSSTLMSFKGNSATGKYSRKTTQRASSLISNAILVQCTVPDQPQNHFPTDSRKVPRGYSIYGQIL